MSIKYEPADLDAMDEQDMAQEKAKTEGAPAFAKAQILASTRYSNRRDALAVVLEEGKLYTDEQIAEALKDYYGKAVH